MEIRQLKYFLAIVSHGSMNRAAESLRLSQPSLSHSIKVLEQSVGAKLLIRGGLGVRPTEIGEKFAKHAQAIVRETEKAIEEVHIMRGVGKSRISVGLLSVLSFYLAPRAFANFLSKVPNVTLDVKVSTFMVGEVANRLRDGDWDVAFTLMGKGVSLASDIVVEPLMTLTSDVYCSVRHPLAAKKHASLEELAHYEWVVSSVGLMEEMLGQAFKGVAKTPKIRLRADSTTLLRALTYEENFLCMMPDKVAEADVKAGRLVKISQDHLTSSSDIVIAYSSLLVRTSVVRNLMSVFFHESAGQA